MSKPKYYLPLIHKSSLSFYPYLRLGGFGLGNILFPFFRAFCFSLQYNANLLYPHYNQIQPRSFLRELNIRSLRNYNSDFNKFKWITLPREKSARIYYLNKFVNEEFVSQEDNILFFGLKNYFYDFFEYRETIRNFIHFSFDLKPKIIKNTAAIHIRLGDFLLNKQSIEPEKIISTIDYFLKKSCKVKIYTDANKQIVTEYLNFSKLLNYVIFVENNSPLRDIIDISQSEHICGSPYSTFLEWARFIRINNYDDNSYSMVSNRICDEINISPLKWRHFI